MLGSCQGVTNCSGEVTQMKIDSSPPCCPVDAAWSAWTSWIAWSATCGNRTRTRTRQCQAGSCNGATVCSSGSGSETERDPSPPCCPVDATWSGWAGWGGWSATCASRSRSRSRSCGGAMCVGSMTCSGLYTERQDDSSPPCCPVNALWSSWGAWNAWSASCGSRTRSQLRTCSGVSCQESTSCSGSPEKRESDSSVCCPVDAVLSPWSSWSTWSKTCGSRTRRRSKTCMAGSCRGSMTCAGSTLDSQDEVVCCRVDGQWSPWMAWSTWSSSCGPRFQTRVRLCSMAACGGSQTCTIGQSDSQNQTDSAAPCCSVDAVWTVWSSWSPLSATCGSSTQYRTRNCTGALCGGSITCKGGGTESHVNKGSCCPVDALWSGWSSWGSWSSTCGPRHRVQMRTCSGGGCGGVLTCPGNASDSEVDAYFPCCPVDAAWTPFGSWSSWTATCGARKRSRHRNCVSAQCGVAETCSGIADDIESDNSQPSCPAPTGEVITTRVSSAQVGSIGSSPSSAPTSVTKLFNMQATRPCAKSTQGTCKTGNSEGQSDDSSSSLVIYIAVGASAGGLLVIVIIVVCCCCMCRSVIEFSVGMFMIIILFVNLGNGNTPRWL